MSIDFHHDKVRKYIIEKLEESVRYVFPKFDEDEVAKQIVQANYF